MVKEAGLEFRIKINEGRYYHSDEVKHNDLMNENYKKTCR